MNEFCRTVLVGEEGCQQQVALLVDVVGRDKWGITVAYQGDNGKLMYHQLEPTFLTSNAALVEVELNSEGLLKSLM